MVIDDYLPLRDTGRGRATLFAGIPEDHSLWGPLIEKAFAKYYGNYEHITGGLA